MDHNSSGGLSWADQWDYNPDPPPPPPPVTEDDGKKEKEKVETTGSKCEKKKWSLRWVKQLYKKPQK
ncbi:PREDICTED: uncharacterized protein LOC104591984 [Nelumbo nucifera]|uniref:Uncharacterized protein n=2 Tax=Nelumbo nucifera TaxID=4432 RepID=A0A822YH94_NELNU|nr:PREDICTED: uncharacterized protein LOC104591984 [Nelumbo nucifera]DAD30659.1 TPA_asm: hypothetical protein HUJ06_009510 [Nelumbo nucifera]